MKIKSLSIVLCCFFIHTLFSQTPCVIKNQAFKAGEELRFKVIYNWGFIWLESAEAQFTVKSTKYKGKVAYVLNGSGTTYSKYDWFFKVRDEFETILDSASFKPLVFRASIAEGSKKEWHNYFFNNEKKKAFTYVKKNNKSIVADSVKMSDCTIDVLTAIYYARNIDFSKCKINDTVNISLIIENKIYPIYIRYLGKGFYSSPEIGNFNCLKFSPLLIEGTIFKGGEGMVVWVSDDKNKIPVYVEAPIVVGSVKVKLISFKGLRNN